MTENAMIAWAGPSATAADDPYAVNPGADALEIADPAAFAQALAWGGPAPKLFEGGTRDVPAQTASGVDPHFIGWLQVGVRHHADDLRTEAEVHALFEQVAGTPDARIEHLGLAAAEARLAAWSRAQQTDAAAAAVAGPKTQAPAESPLSASARLGGQSVEHRRGDDRAGRAGRLLWGCQADASLEPLPQQQPRVRPSQAALSPLAAHRRR